MTAAWYFCSWQKATEDKEWLCLLSKRLASFFIPYWNRNRKSLRIENEKHNWNWKQHTSVSQMRYHLHWILNALILLSWNQRTNWCDVFLNKIRPKNGVCFTSSKQLAKGNFLEKFAQAGKHLRTSIGLWRLHNSVESVEIRCKQKHKHTGELLYCRNWSCHSEWNQNWHRFSYLIL